MEMEDESRPEPPPPEQLAGDDVLEWLTVDEDTLEELMKVLETDNNNNNPTPFHEEASSSSSFSSASCINGVNYGTNFTRVRFIENPYSATVVFQASSSYITINGNEETCGSSFSDWEASVMASVDTGGTNVGPTGGRRPGDEDEKEGFICDELLGDVDGGGGGGVV